MRKCEVSHGRTWAGLQEKGYGVIFGRFWDFYLFKFSKDAQFRLWCRVPKIVQQWFIISVVPGPGRLVILLRWIVSFILLRGIFPSLPACYSQNTFSVGHFTNFHAGPLLSLPSCSPNKRRRLLDTLGFRHTWRATDAQSVWCPYRSALWVDQKILGLCQNFL